jgi:RNA polymerase sigma factor (sigma-70 family)
MTTMTIPATSASARHLGRTAAAATPGLAPVARGRSACVAEREREMECPEGVGTRAVDPDALLVERLRRQEAGAAEALVAAYGKRVYRLAIRITGDSSDAEEVVQDALWAVMRKIDTFRGAAAFSSWLYRITANAAYQKLRGRRTKGKRDVVGSSRPIVRRERPVRGAGARLVDESTGSGDSRGAPVRAQRGHRRSAGGVPCALSLVRGGRTLAPRDRRSAAGERKRGEVAGAPSTDLSEEALGRLHRRYPDGLVPIAGGAHGLGWPAPGTFPSSRTPPELLPSLDEHRVRMIFRSGVECGLGLPRLLTAGPDQPR